MRDDTVTIRGPFEIPSFWGEDPDTGEPRWIDMSGARRLEFSTDLCGCDRSHGYSLELAWDTMLRLGEKAATWAVSSGYEALRIQMANCEFPPAGGEMNV
jgi:hypothetical protein